MTEQRMPMTRRTGSWVVRSTEQGYLMAATDSLHAWSSDAPDALIFDTKTAVRDALRGYRRRPGERIEIERSYGHEDGTEWPRNAS